MAIERVPEDLLTVSKNISKFQLPQQNGQLLELKLWIIIGFNP